ncbi:HAMP domain-containing sensor histidine kinase [Spirobacillus cienkowskii]|uniref:sensor histidine kinase n=1 Tax=Spirobacillus cienkowskii TaxID=495820 RepID=UPI0030CEA997
MIAGSKTLKFYFLLSIIFSFLFPFVLSIILFWNFISHTNEKMRLANSQLQRSMNLELIDTFHKIQSSIVMVSQSVELKNYFDSTIDEQSSNYKKFTYSIDLIRKKMPYHNTKWLVYNTRGNLIVNIPDKNYSTKIDLNETQKYGAYLNNSFKRIEFFIPISYKIIPSQLSIKNKIGYIIVLLDINEIQKNFPMLLEIQAISNNLDIEQFKTKFNLIYMNNIEISFIYLYIFISFIFSIILIIFGLQIFQRKIVDKIIFLRNRVINERKGVEKNLIVNELESLSFTFDLFLRYTEYLQREMNRNSQLIAVGNIAHLIAHDIKKPFTKLEFFIQEIKKISNKDNNENIKKLLVYFEPHIKSSVDYIDHMLKEIMEAGVNELNILENVKLENIINKSIKNLIIVQEDTNIELLININNDFYLNVDENRIVRVFVNILNNAIEAMNFYGKIWINSNLIKSNNILYAEICIGNSNSYIPADKINRLFDPFYTIHKTHGTGLGLAIAQKIVNLHGGVIRCQSQIEKGVEFIFTLPVSTIKYNVNISEIPNNIKGQKLFLDYYEELTSESKNYFTETLVVIDDDPLICKSWKRNVNDINVLTFLSPENFLLYIDNNKEILGNIKYLVSDYYFGKGSRYLFEDFIVKLKKIYGGKIFLSSDLNLESENFIKKEKIIIIKKRVYSAQELKKF